MSKLDEILDIAGFEPYRGTMGIAKQQIKDLFLEIIGTDEWNPLPKRKNYVGIRNSLKAELRKKVEDL